MKALARLTTILGILQQSHYDGAFFGAWVLRHPTPADWDAFEDKIKVNWTWKARLLFYSSIAPSRLLPSVLRFNLLCLRPCEWLAIKIICFAARRRMERFNFRAVIGITGSFGKTTTKEILARVLGAKFSVRRTPENTNTLLGVARWIMREQFADGDIAIVEMGAYSRGDIAALCAMARPTIGILTGLNEAHRERFGSLEATAAAKSELIDALPMDGVGLWNADSENLKNAVQARLKKWVGRGIRVVPYSRKENAYWDIDAQDHQETKVLIRARGKTGSHAVIEDVVDLFGLHHCAPLSAALFLAKELGMPQEEICQGIKKLHPLDRRLTPLYVRGNRLLIDDSYNATLDGAIAALDALSGIKRRKIGVFAGIQEHGEESERINRELGGKISKCFDIILLGRTQAADAIERGIREAGFTSNRLICYNDGKEVEEILKKITQDGDCVYFSPYDRPALYI